MYSWLQVEPLNSLLPPSPLLGYCPPVDIEHLKEVLTHKLKIDVQSLTPKWQYSPLEQAKARLPIDNHRFNYAIAGQSGLIELYFSRSELSQIARAILGADCPLSESSKEAILDFFVSTLMTCIISESPFQEVQPSLVAKTQQIKSRKVLEASIEFACEEGTFKLHLLIEDSLYQAWLNHWAQTPYLGVQKTTAESIALTVDVGLGNIELPAGQLSKLQVGDWISLKSLGLNESLNNSPLTLTLGQTKLGDAKLQEGQILVASRDEFFDRLKSK